MLRTNADAGSIMAAGCRIAIPKLFGVLETKAPLITSSWRLQARNAPTRNSLMLDWMLPCIQETREPTARGTVQIKFDATERAKMRLSETIESWSTDLIAYVVR